MVAPLFQQFDGHTWKNFPPPVPAIASPGAFAVLNGVVYCAFQGPGNSVCVATFNGQAWQTAVTIANATTPTTPALAALNGQLLCVYQRQSDGALHFSAFSTATRQWSADAPIRLSSGDTLDGIFGSPALVVFKNTLYCLYQRYGYTGNLRCATFDGTAWQQMGGKGKNLPNVPGMSQSPTAAVLGQKLYCLYQGYGADGAHGNGALTGATFDGTNWVSLGTITARCMSASPSAVTWSDGRLWVFFQGFENNGSLVGMVTSSGASWTLQYDEEAGLVPETGPAAAVVAFGTNTWLVVDGLAQYARPTYARSTTMSDTAALALLQEFAPVVYLSSKEKYFPASVDWYLPLVTMTYTHAVQDTPQTDVILHQVTKANINTQVSGDEFSWLIPYQDGTTTKFTAALDFRLSIINQKTYYGQQPPPPVSPQAPFYGAVIDNPAVGATDLLYMFFYGYNGEAGIAFGGLGTHEADWEHVIIRLSADKSKIMGMYCQAHASDGAYSKWYYKSGSSGPPNFETYGASQRPIVYSAAESHASYTSAGTFNIGGPGGILGEDETDEGALWNATANVVLVSLPETNWLQFSGRWGATNDTFGKSPDPPAAQGWLVPRSDGPHGWITGPLT